MTVNRFDEPYNHLCITSLLSGIYNYDEYLLVRDEEEVERERTMTMQHHRKGGSGSVGGLGGGAGSAAPGTLRDADKMDKLRRELRTDDDGKRFHSTYLIRRSIACGTHFWRDIASSLTGVS